MNVEEFIQKHENTSIAALSLILSKKENIPKDFIINQINGRRKAKTKFPSLSKLSTYIFPSPRAIEQASSEQAATYKSELVGGKKMADLSGGMGLDSYFFAKQFESVDYIEQDSELCETSRQNFKALAANNIHCFNQNAVDFLKLNKKEYDLIYIDPDRRAAKHKAFLIDDCEPNLKELLPLIWKCTNYCLIKLSPMLDIKQALTELKFCKKVHIVSIKNDCKELLFELEKDFMGTPLINCINLEQENIQKFHFTFEQEDSLTSELGEVSTYLFDPNVSILKAGAFKSIAKRFNFNKLSINTHLYTSIEWVDHFPGRHFQVIKEVKLKKGLFPKANIICKNYPLKPEQIKTKFKIKDGGDLFLIAYTDNKNRRRVMLCKKI